MAMMTGHDAPLWAATLLSERRSTLPKRLHGPGPDAAQRAAILQAAASAPDHHQILPWRFVEVPGALRQSLGLAFDAALLERDPHADEQARAQAREKALRAPWLMLLVVRTGGEPSDVPAAERLLSAGAAVQNMLLMATACGLGSSLTSGKALQSKALRTLFGLSPLEEAICFVNIGHVSSQRQARQRPDAASYFSVLGAAHEEAHLALAACA